MSDGTALTAAAAAGARMFDEQARDYDARAGLPAAAGALVARAIVEAASLQPGDLVVELGAGTGEIGAHLARLPMRYVGLDLSPLMLDVFRVKAAGEAPWLVVADGDRGWPLPAGRSAVVFASRVIHLLQPDHAVRETLRVCRPAGFLILGRVLRDPDGIKERLRRRRQELLEGVGIRPRQGAAGTRRVVELCQAAGAESLGRRVVAEWSGETTPEAVITTWDHMSRMGSVPVDLATRGEILSTLRDWAREEFGGLDQPRTTRERYALDIVRLP